MGGSHGRLDIKSCLCRTASAGRRPLNQSEPLLGASFLKGVSGASQRGAEHESPDPEHWSDSHKDNEMMALRDALSRMISCSTDQAFYFLYSDVLTSGGFADSGAESQRISNQLPSPLPPQHVFQMQTKQSPHPNHLILQGSLPASFLDHF